MMAAAALALLAGAACEGGPGPQSGAAGHLTVSIVTKRASRLLDEPGLATYCASDSLLTIIAIGHGRAAGFAARVTLPLHESRSMAIQAVLGGTGSATAAFRLANGAARVGTAGTLRLEQSGAISGDFEVSAPDSAGVPARFQGKLSRIPVRNARPGACGIA
jgi:hypothetical protein